MRNRNRAASKAKQDREQAIEQDRAGQRAGRSRTATRIEDPYWRIASRPKRDRAGRGRTEQDREQDRAGQGAGTFATPLKRNAYPALTPFGIIKL